MDVSPAGPRLHFGDVTLVPEERLVLRNGQAVPMTPKAFDLLLVLTQHPGRLLTKEQLMQAVWNDTAVEEANLSYHVFAIRKALGDTAENGLIATVPKRGYRFTGAVTHVNSADPRPLVSGNSAASLWANPALPTQPADDGAVRVAVSAEPRTARNPVRRRVLGILGALGLAAAVAAAFFAGRLAGISPVNMRDRVVASLVLPGGMRLAGRDLYSESRFAVSPDGRRLAVVAADESGRARLWLRELASATFQPLPGTEDASYPFWSPDSESIAFVAAAKLKTIRASGGPPVAVCDGGFRTGAWGRDGSILFAPASSSPLYRVRASGGEPTRVTTLDSARGEIQHAYPVFLPDGRHFLYASVGSRTGGTLDPQGVYVGSLDGAERVKLLLPGATQARYASGHVLFLQGGKLMAQPFDVTRMERSGTPFPLVEQINVSTAGATGVAWAFSVSEHGVLVYQTASTHASQPTWFDRNGRELGVLGRVADYGDVALSRDGATLAVSIMDPALSTRDLWLYDVDSGRGQRLTTDAGDEFAPVWAPDGKRLLFSSLHKGSVNLYVKQVNGLGDQQPVKADNLGLGRFAADWSRDDRFIMYVGGGRPIDQSDLWVASVASPQPAHALLESSFLETHGRFAPDGRWFLYTSNETGRLEVYADRFPNRGAKRLVSTAGGGWARWARDGSEVYYLSPDSELMAATVHATADRLEVATPRRLFAVRTRSALRLDAYPYDVSPDGLRFVVNTLVAEPTSTAITIVLNWTDALTSR